MGIFARCRYATAISAEDDDLNSMSTRPEPLPKWSFFRGAQTAAITAAGELVGTFINAPQAALWGTGAGFAAAMILLFCQVQGTNFEWPTEAEAKAFDAETGTQKYYTDSEDGSMSESGDEKAPFGTFTPIDAAPIN